MGMQFNWRSKPWGWPLPQLTHLWAPSLFWLIDKTIGLRVTEVEEDIGLDIAQHAERAYVEQ